MKTAASCTKWALSGRKRNCLHWKSNLHSELKGVRIRLKVEMLVLLQNERLCSAVQTIRSVLLLRIRPDLAAVSQSTSLIATTDHVDSCGTFSAEDCFTTSHPVFAECCVRHLSWDISDLRRTFTNPRPLSDVLIWICNLKLFFPLEILVVWEWDGKKYHNEELSQWNHTKSCSVATECSVLVWNYSFGCFLSWVLTWTDWASKKLWRQN